MRHPCYHVIFLKRFRNRDIRLAPKVGKIGLKWEQIRDYFVQITFQCILARRLPFLANLTHFWNKCDISVDKYALNASVCQRSGRDK